MATYVLTTMHDFVHIMTLRYRKTIMLVTRLQSDHLNSFLFQTVRHGTFDFNIPTKALQQNTIESYRLVVLIIR